jgi:hypothetical protein
MIYSVFALAERIRSNFRMKRGRFPPDVVLVWILAALRFRFPGVPAAFGVHIQVVEHRVDRVDSRFLFFLAPSRLG